MEHVALRLWSKYSSQVNTYSLLQSRGVIDTPVVRPWNEYRAILQTVM